MLSFSLIVHLPEWLRRRDWKSPVASDWDLWWVFLLGDVTHWAEGRGGGGGTCKPDARCFRQPAFPFGLKKEKSPLRKQGQKQNNNVSSVNEIINYNYNKWIINYK